MCSLKRIRYGRPAATAPALGAMLGLGMVLIFGFGSAASAQEAKAHFGFGTPATPAQIQAWDIDVEPDGTGLPAGGGTAAQGEPLYAAQCASCHGDNLEGIRKTGGETLIGGRGTLASDNPLKTVESYWPYAPTLFDFINRAMPFQAPGSLSADDVYAVSAYILFRAELIPKDEEMNAKTLPRVKMPNRDGFVPDPRPDVP